MIYVVVDKKIIPMKTNKYAEILDKVKALTEKEALQIQEGEGVSFQSIMSLMRKAGYKVILSTENKIKYLYIAKAEPKPKKA